MPLGVDYQQRGIFGNNKKCQPMIMFIIAALIQALDNHRTRPVHAQGDQSGGVRHVFLTPLGADYRQ